MLNATRADRLADRVWRAARRAIGRHPSNPALRLPRDLIGRPVDLIYINSVASLPAGRAARSVWDVPVICHVHELEWSIRTYSSPADLRDSRGYVDCYIAVSRAVERNLIERHGIPADRIRCIYPGIPLNSPLAVGPQGPDNGRPAALNLPADAFVVGGCGALDWRKGADIFVQIAAEVVRVGCKRPVHFVWVGGRPSSTHARSIQEDAEKLGVASLIHFVGMQQDPSPYFAAFDAFLLSSREDPFPLVCLEASSYGIPTVCFERAGGIQEFVEDDAGFVVPYLNTRAAAERIVDLAHDERLRRRLGLRALQKVRDRHDLAISAQRIETVIAEQLAASDPARRVAAGAMTSHVPPRP
jgi:glycosyltransferase involved in cell wall biosynthesis